MMGKRDLERTKIFKNWIWAWGLIGTVAILGAVYYYNLLLNIPIPVHSDDAGSTIAIYDENILGGQEKTQGNLQIFMIFSRISYALFGYTEFAMRIVFCMSFFCMVLGSLYLITRNKNRNIVVFDILLFAYIVVLQGTSGAAQIQISKFHTNPTICLLLLLGFSQAYQLYHKKRYIILGGAVFVFSLAQLDYLLTIIVIVVPLSLYAFLYMLHSARCKKYLPYLIIIIPGVIFGIRVADKLYLKYSGVSLFEISAWGANRVFAGVEEIKNNVILFFEGIMGMFNCNASGTSLISLESINWFIRFCLLGTMLVILVSFVWKLIVAFKTVDFIDGILTISCVVTIFAYLLTPQEDAISMRYCNMLLFALPILFLRYIGRLEFWNGNYTVFVKNISKDAFIGIGIMGLILCMVKLIPIERRHMENDDLAEAVVENNLKNGVAPYWAASVISLLTSENSIVQAVTMDSGGMQPYLDTISLYDDKCKMFNFIIEDKEVTDAYDDNIFGVNENNIVTTYGVPEQCIEVGKNKTIYVYDYDVRTMPLIISPHNSRWVYSGGKYNGVIDFGESIYMESVDLELGEYYIVIEGCNLGKDVKLLFNGEPVELVEEDDVKFLKFYVKLDSFVNVNQVMVQNNMKEKAYIKDVKIQGIREAVDLSFDGQIASEDAGLNITKSKKRSEKFKVTPGNYKIVFYGENIDEMTVDLEGEVENFIVKEHGQERVVCTFSCSEQTDFEISLSNLSNKKVVLTNASIEMQDNKNLKKYSAVQLEWNENAKLEDGCIKLKEDGTQYGPYIGVEAGTYKVVIVGENLEKAVYECYAEGSEIKIDVQNLKIQPNETTYFIELDRELQNVEFLVHNPSEEDTVKVVFCTLEKIDGIEMGKTH